MQKNLCFNISFIILGCYFLICLIFNSCKNNEENFQYKFETIPVFQYLNRNLKLNLSDFVDTVYYIKPEFNKEILPASYKKVIIRNDTVLILDSFNRIFLYKTDGKYIGGFDKRGRGPGEYYRIADIAFINGKIIILDNTTSIKAYNLSGELIKQAKTDLFPMYIMQSYNEILTYSVPPVLMMSNYYRFESFDNKLNKSKVFYRTFYNNMEPNSIASGQSSFYNYFDTLSFYETFRDTIFRVTKNKKIIPRYCLSLGREGFPWEMSLTRKGWSEITKYDRIMGVFETEKLFLLNVVDAPENYFKTILIDKSGKIGGNVVFNLSIIDGGFHNDYDGGYPFWPKAQIDERTLITWFDPISFRKDFLNDYFKKINTQYPKLATKIRSDILDTDDLMNEWIMVVKFK